MWVGIAVQNSAKQLWRMTESSVVNLVACWLKPGSSTVGPWQIATLTSINGLLQIVGTIQPFTHLNEITCGSIYETYSWALKKLFMGTKLPFIWLWECDRLDLWGYLWLNLRVHICGHR